jgi:protein required for attachment to host cells
MDYNKDVDRVRNQVLLVANSTVARVYELKGLKIGKLIFNLSAAETITEHHNEGRRDNFSQRMSMPGNFLDPHQDAKQMDRVNFSKVIAEKLLTLHQQELFNSLTIISDSKVLGDLRSYLNKEILSLVNTEIVENLSHADTQDIEKHLTAFQSHKQNI